MSGNDMDHFPVKTGKFAFPYPESNVYQKLDCSLRGTPTFKIVECQVTDRFLRSALNTLQTIQQC